MIPFRLTLAALALGVLAACSPKPDATAVDATPAAVDETTAQYFATVVGDRVFFQTDSSALDAIAQDTLGRQAQWLAANAAVTMTIEGHADERGTREYNLALGERRANAVLTFLLGQGVAPNRLRTVSYGKERPEAVCSDESCWSQNRRGVSAIAGAPVS
jgi:peptidoglycan-associated lipoprotein